MRNKFYLFVLIIGLFCFVATAPAETICLEELPADVNGDCFINITDLLIMGQQWLDPTCTPPLCADLDAMTGVHYSDFSLLSSEWQKSAAADIVIHEFMASNTTVLADEDGQYPDWIELKNTSDAVVSLDGWYLTDDAEDTNKWRIPDVSINPGEYLVIFASLKDRSEPNSTLHTNFNLDINGEYLGLYLPDQTLAHEYAPEYPPQAEDVSFGLTVIPGENVYTTGYFLTPTHGADNSISVSNLGPNIENVAHLPLEPGSSEPLVVTAAVTPKIDAVGPVTLYYRVMYGSETSISMYDDGAHNDGAAGDNIYGATIPSGIASPGEMIRYYITASDTSANDNRNPLALDLIGMRQSPEYYGTVIADPTLTSNIAVLHWFVEDTAAADHRWDRTGTRASLYYNGEFYDNIYCRVRGGSITNSVILNTSYKFEFNRGYYFRFSPAEARVDEFNLNSSYPDKAYIRQVLGFESFRDAGGEYCETFPMRVHRNGQFFSVQVFVEQVDEEYLQRHGLDPEGALYKMYSNMSTPDGQKKTREYEDNSDLLALVDGIALTGTAQEKYLFDNINLPSIVNYAAVNTIINDTDHGSKNYYAYRDTNGSGQWRYLPWDKDLTFGKKWNSSDLLLDDTLYYTGNLEATSWNRLLGAIYSNSRTEEMYDRRLRSLVDLLLKEPGTPYAELYYENRADELYTLMLPDATLHYNEWADPWAYGQDQSFADAIGYLKSDYLDPRRSHIYVTMSGSLVDAQVGNPAINIGTIEFNPSSFNQDEEYIELVNPNAVAVDISGWKLTGGVTFTFESGTVICAGETMYVSPNLAAFRARTSSPTGDESNFVCGNYKGHLSSWGETINLLAADDSLIDTVTYTGAPSDQQRYLRITELMYHPIDPNLSSPYNDEDFEYIELLNIGTAPLDLTGVKFTNGIDFQFGSSLTLTPLLATGFDSDSDGFAYADDTFGTSNPSYATGSYEASGGFSGGGLRVYLGPGDMYSAASGGWSDDFTLASAGSVTVSVRYRMIMSQEYESNEYGEAILAIDGVRYGSDINDSLIHKAGSGIDYGWQEYETTITLTAGPHTITLGAYNNDATYSNEWTEVFFDDISVFVSAPDTTTSTLDAGRFALLVKNQAAFESRYGTGLNVLGQYTGSLSNGGEGIKLEDPTNSTILSFDYKDSWYNITDGDDFSLTIVDANDTNLDIWDDKDGWRASTTSGGTPGREDTGTLIPGDIVINELLAHSDTLLYDWIELHNTTDNAINIGGWFLSDSDANNLSRMKYEIAAGTTIDPNGYVVFYENVHFGNPADAGCNTPFQYSENGETAFLQSGQAGALTGYYVEEDFGASEPDVAFGRYYKTSTDSYNFVAMSSNTPGSANAYPKVGPIVINEIMYHPQLNPDAEYVELLNISGSSVTLYDYSTNEPWQFIDDAGDSTPDLEFYFPTGVPITLAPGQYLLLVKNVTAFHSEFTPESGVTILEWNTGSLSNGGEEPLLSMPGDVNGQDQRQYIRIDKVNYSDGSHPVGEDPWPDTPDGGGSSLSRITSTNYGNEAANWQAAAPSPGRADFP